MASNQQSAIIRLPLLLWMRVIFQLRWRSGGKRESGAFLLGRLNGRSARVTSFVCYDDLDPNVYKSGVIAFHAVGYAALWQLCRANQLEVLADIHTHPGSNIRQSPIDQRNPMLPVRGHTALIVPNHGRICWWSLSSVGIYQYSGNFKWETHEHSSQSRRINLTLW